MNRDRVLREVPEEMARWLEQHGSDATLEQVARDLAVAMGARLLADDPMLSAVTAMRHVRDHFELFTASKHVYARLRSLTKPGRPSPLSGSHADG